MRTRKAPLLCELHAHSSWSDGALSLRELVDLHGMRGFDVLCVTDHTLRSGSTDTAPGHVPAPTYPAYLADVEAEARRALDRYGLLVVPGLELTFDDPDPLLAAHALALGLRTFVGLDDDFEAALRSARRHGAAVVAAHPHSVDAPPNPLRLTKRFAADRWALRGLVDRYELFNQNTLYPWVAEAGFPGVAGGDVHRPEQLNGWKTLVPCAKSEEAFIGYLRSPLAVFLARVGGPSAAELAA